MIKLKVKTVRKYLKEIAILVLGVALILISKLSFDNKTSNNKSDKFYGETVISDVNSKTAAEYFTEYYEAQIKEFVSKIDGVSDVSVIVHISSTDDMLLAENIKNETEKITEKDSNGGSRDTVSEKNSKEYVIIKDANGNENIVVLSSKMPVITGVAICAQGCQSYVVQEKIINAIKNTYGLKASQIYVCR